MPNLDFLNGKINGFFLLGQSIEQHKEILEKEKETAEISISSIEELSVMISNLKEEIILEQQAGLMQLKETEYALKWIEKILNLNFEQKVKATQRLYKSKGAIEVTNLFIKMTKDFWDKEKENVVKLSEINQDPNILKFRQVGTNPGNPLEDYKNNK